MVYYFGDTSQDLAEYIEAMRPLAKQYQPYLAFVTVNSTKQARKMGLQSGKGLVIENPHAGHIYPYKGDARSIAGVEAFIADISAGMVSPWEMRGGRTRMKDEL